MSTAFITHPDCLKHEMGPHHPESPERLAAILKHFQVSGLMQRLTRIEAPQATRAMLERAHNADYVARIFSISPQSGYASLDPDTAMNPFSLDAALRAAGAVAEAVDRVMAGKVNSAFCAVRPCGHHATRDRSMGFCIFNNVAVGALHALEAHGLARVAILDFDVHHGNGTEDIFHDDARVMLCSSFQHPYYPGSGTDSGNDHIIPTPLAAYTDGAHFRRAIEATWLPALESFKPELVMVSAGFDAHADDPLAQLELHEDDYAWVTEKLCDIAGRFAQGRVVSVLEGGYDLTALAMSAQAHVEVLLRRGV